MRFSFERLPSTNSNTLSSVTSAPMGFLAKAVRSRHQHLVGLLDDRPVAAAVMPRSAGLEPDARHDPDAEVDVMRRVRVELDEIVLVDVGAAGRALQPQGSVQRALVIGEEFLAAAGSALGLLRQNTLGGHLPDVGRGEVDPVAEAVLKFGQIDPLGVDGGDHFVELFLRGDDDPARGHDLRALRAGSCRPCRTLRRWPAGLRSCRRCGRRVGPPRR